MDLEFFIYDSPKFKRFLRDNPHEHGEVKFLESILEEGMYAIDVGGHIGVTSVVIAKKIGDKGRLYSFEPVPKFFNILKKSFYDKKRPYLCPLSVAVANFDKISYTNDGKTSDKPFFFTRAVDIASKEKRYSAEQYYW